MQPYGAPSQPEPEGASSTVKLAVALVMAAVVLAVVEAILAIYIQQGILSDVNNDSEDIQQIKISFGVLVGVNLVLAAGLSGGALLTLQRKVAGKAMVWAFGILSLFMRVGCGGMAVLFIWVANSLGEEDMPFPAWALWAIIAIEVVALLVIIAAMAMLMTKGASFKDPPAGVGPPGGYGAPYGGPPTGSPMAPPMSGPPTSAPPDGLPHLPPTPGWPGA
ncbi:MAG: hypothetical protein ACRDT4_13900 [Micromonosporaceae bacterium]